MSLIKCPECGKEISEKATSCPNCGHPINNKTRKRPTWLIIVASIGGIIALFVCFSALSDLKKATSVKKSDESAISSNSETKESEEEQKPKVAFTVNTDEELANLPAKDGYIDSVVSAAKSIGVTDVVKSEIGNYEEISDIINLSAKCETENGNVLIITSMYITVTSKWSTLSIVDYYTGNYYFVPEEQHDFVDLYDYKTGEIISRKTKDFEDYDAVEDFNKRIEEIDGKSEIIK